MKKKKKKKTDESGIIRVLGYFTFSVKDFESLYPSIISDRIFLIPRHKK